MAVGFTINHIAAVFPAGHWRAFVDGGLPDHIYQRSGLEFFLINSGSGDPQTVSRTS